MGFRTEVFPFDIRMFDQQVVPAFEQLLAGKGLSDWLAQRMETHHWESATYADPAWPNKYWSRSSDPQHAQCWQVWTRGLCIDRGQFLGRSYNVEGYRTHLAEQMGVPFDHRLSLLLVELGYRGWEVCDACANRREVEGVAGWLDPVETYEFARLLDGLDIPAVEHSWDAMQAAWDESRQWDWTGPGRGASLVGWTRLGLAFMCNIAYMAVDEQQGFIWGHDLPGDVGF